MSLPPCSRNDRILGLDVAVSNRFGTGHHLGIQNAPAGGPLQITDHRSQMCELCVLFCQQ